MTTEQKIEIAVQRGILKEAKRHRDDNYERYQAWGDTAKRIEERLEKLETKYGDKEAK